MLKSREEQMGLGELRVHSGDQAEVPKQLREERRLRVSKAILQEKALRRSFHPPLRMQGEAVHHRPWREPQEQCAGSQGSRRLVTG